MLCGEPKVLCKLYVMMVGAMVLSLRLRCVAVRGRGGVSIEVDSACRVGDGIWRSAALRLDETVAFHRSWCCQTVGLVG